MRKLLTTALLCLPLALSAQQKQPKDQSFGDYTQRLDNERQLASRKQENLHGDSLIRQWLSRYAAQPDTTRAKYKGTASEMYYNLACFDALMGHKQQALTYLEESVKFGFVNYNNIVHDSDLVSLHDEKRYQAAQQLIRERGDMGYILRISGPYNQKVNKALPTFTYQAATSPDLIAFKNKYKLDSVAGNGDEISRIKNLLLWVHNTVKHDGSAPNPAVKNGAALIAVCQKQNLAVNCRMLATILKDVYEAEGFNARIVTCKPKDTADMDCHVINVVWSKTLNKWLWMDPTFYAYVSDNKGNLLSIGEVRNYLHQDKLNELILNSDANRNNMNKQSREYYLGYYMSKNLYWLQCAVSNSWDLETEKPGNHVTEYVNLYPEGYNLARTSKRMLSGAKEYATNNPEWFWQRPAGVE